MSAWDGEDERLARGRKAWAGVGDAAEWVRDIRGTDELPASCTCYTDDARRLCMRRGACVVAYPLSDSP